MAGRGRGRGRGLSINIEALGLGRGEILPPVAHPPPLFPPLAFKPIALTQSDELDYMLALKQELREQFLRSPFHIKAPSKVKDIERYSDKYQVGASEASAELVSDWSRLPFELHERTKKRKKISKSVGPNLKSARFPKNEDVSSLLEKLEKNDAVAENDDDADGQDEENEEKKEQKEEDDEEEDEEYDEEDLEETDYNLNYFDNGEDYGDDDEDDDEGPTY